MADENLDPEIIRKLNAGLDLTAAEQRKLARITGKTAKETQTLGDAAQQAAKQLGGFYGQLIRTQQGSEFVAREFKGLVSIAGSFGSVLGKTKGLAELAGGKFGKVAGALAKLGVGVGEAGELIANMSDRLFVSFQDLSRVGAAGAEGMAGVFDQMQNFRLGLEDLGQLTQLLGANAESLVLFGGSVEQGAKSLGALRKFVTGSRLEQEFMGLGMNTQEINEAMTGFVAIQSRMGMRQVTDYAKVAASLDAYIAEQDKITRLTGATRKQQEDAAMKALATEQFRAKIMALEAEGTEASMAEAKRLMGINVMLSSANEDLGAAFRASTAGFVTQGPAVTGQLVTQGRILDLVNNKQLEGAAAAAHVKEGLDQFMSGVGRTQMAVGGFETAFKANAAGLVDGSKKLGAFADGSKTADQAQAEMRARTDEGVKAQVDLRTATMNTMQNLQTLTNVAVPAVTNGLAILAGAANSASIALLEMTGQGGKAVGGTPGYGQGGTGTQQGSVAATGAGAAGAAAAASRLPIPHPLVKGAVVGGAAALGGLGGYGTYQGMGGQEIDPDKVIKFDPSGTGSRAHFDKLRPDVRKNALAMAYAYEKATGQRLRLTSAFRSVEEQAALQRQGGPFPIAEPGASLHQQGRALDFNSADIDALERMGLLQQFGFNRLRGDPPHIYMQDGGIASGPKSGYQATLHGTEAVVPLPDGKAIPVEMPGMSNQMNMMSDQISRLDELIALMRNQNGISHRILQAATN